jgi:hypothetical protein
MSADVENLPVPRDWSRAYWVVVINQLLALAGLTTIISALVRNSMGVCEPRHLALPAITINVFQLGPTGVQIVVGMCGLSLLLLALFRKHWIGVVAATVIFLATLVFLVFAMIAAILPLIAFANSVRP